MQGSRNRCEMEAEALKQEFDGKKLTPAYVLQYSVLPQPNCACISMIKYVMDELQDYAKLVDEATGIEARGFGQ